MKTIFTALAATLALAAVAAPSMAAANPWRYHHQHCAWRHHHRHCW